MVIRKMNTVLVKHNKILFGIFSFIIIVSFVWFFTPGLDGSMFFGQDMNSPNLVVGTVFGEKVKLKEYQQAMRERMLLLTAMTGRDSSQFQDYISQTLFDEIAREKTALKLGITVSDTELTNFIKNGFALFRNDKGFDPELYKKFGENFLSREGMTLADFENVVRKMLAAEKLSTQLTGSATVTPQELDLLAELQKEKFHARMVKFPFASFKPAKKFTDDEIMNYYKANSKQFMTAPLIRALVVKFPYTPANITPSAKEIQDYYKAHEKEFTQNNKLQPLAQVKKQIIAALRLEAGKKLAAEKAKKFRDQIYDAAAADSVDSGKGQLLLFNSLATKNKYNVIRTVWFDANTKNLAGIGNEPELVKALFQANLQHTPILRASLQGNNGVYVAALSDVQPSKLADFKDVKAKAEELLIAERSKMAAKEAALNFIHKLNAEKNKSAALQQVAAKAKGVVTKLPVFTREARPADMVQQFAMQNAALLADGAISNSEETPDAMIVICLDKREQATAKEKEEAKKQLEAVMAYSKQMMQQSSLMTWIRSNCVDNFRQQQNN